MRAGLQPVAIGIYDMVREDTFWFDNTREEGRRRPPERRDQSAWINPPGAGNCRKAPA